MTFSASTLSDVATAALRRASPTASRVARSDGEQSWDTFVAAVERVRPAHLAIDVYGSVLRRRLAGQEAAHLAIATDLIRRELWAGTVAQYLSARRMAMAQCPDGTLEEFYEVPALASQATAPMQSLIEAEVACEAGMIEPVPGVRVALTALRTIVPISFVRNSPLGEVAIAELLTSYGLYSPVSDKIISVKEAGRRRRANGSLSPAPLDPAPPDHARLDRYEQQLASHWSSYGPAIAAASRSARTNEGGADADAHLEGLRQLGASGIGSMMVAFLSWIRDQGSELGIRHFEFLARDGELPLQVARAMPTPWWEGYTLNYLHCGRRSWSLAAASLVGIEDWIFVGAGGRRSFLLHSSDSVPFGVLLDRCGLSLDDVDHSELRTCALTAPLSHDQVTAWQACLLSGSLNDLIERRSLKPRDLALRFLAERGIPRSRIGMVDVGWRGHQAWLSSALVREAIGLEPTHFHFGGDGVDPWLSGKVDIRRFALDDSLDQHPIAEPVLCLEVFLSSGKPRLIGYEEVAYDEATTEEERTGEAALSGEDATRVVERFEVDSIVLDGPEKAAILEGAVQVGSFMPTPAELEAWGAVSASLREPTRQILRLLWGEPLASEATLIAPLAFEGDDRGKLLSTVAHPYQLDDMYKTLPRRRQWRQGSLAITPQPFRTIFGPYVRRAEGHHAAKRRKEHDEIRRAVRRK